MQPENNQKLQLIPIKHPLIKPEQQQIDEKHNRTSTTTTNGGSPDINKNNGKNKKSVEKQNKQKDKVKVTGKASNLKKQTSTNKENGTNENDKLTKQLSNVKFSFDDAENVKDESPSSAAEEEKKLIENVNNNNEVLEMVLDAQTQIDENIPLVVVELEDAVEKANENGNYDELPLINIETVREQNRIQDIENQNNINQKSIGFSRSSESIPFIDEDGQPKVSPVRLNNFHDSKYITMTAKNVGSNITSTPKTDKILDPESPKPDRFDKSVQLLYQENNNEMTFVIRHDFKSVADIKEGRLCQICHFPLKRKTTVRCSGCDFLCHDFCAEVVSRI